VVVVSAGASRSVHIWVWGGVSALLLYLYIRARVNRFFHTRDPTLNPPFGPYSGHRPRGVSGRMGDMISSVITL